MPRLLRFLLAAASGFFLYQASPGPGHRDWLVWFALAPLLLALCFPAAPPGAVARAGDRPHLPGRLETAATGFICGLFFYLPLLSWIHTVLATYGGLSSPLASAAAVLLAGYMAIYPALFALLLRGIPLLAAPALWVALDVLRGVLFTGFPWMDLGYDLFRRPALLQIAAVTGHHGLTFTIVLANSLLAGALIHAIQAAGLRQLGEEPRPQADADGAGRSAPHSKGMAKPARPAGPRFSCRSPGSALSLLPSGRGLAAGFLLLAFIIGLAGWRFQRLAGEQPRPERLFAAGIVQGAIEQDKKWLPSELQRALDRHLGLTAQLLRRPASPPARPRLVVWPETSLPAPPARLAGFTERLTTLLGPSDTMLLTGVPWEGPGPTYFNRAILLAPNGRITGHYDKQHLVPFGEYIPLRPILPALSPVVETLADFTPGSPGPPLACGPARLGVLICFESIFPALARQSVTQGADLLINITNDAWFGRSNAPYQHFAMSVLRAVENRRPLLRAANTGISGVIDPLGRIVQRTDLFQPAIILATVERRADQTIYTRGGHWFAAACVVATVLLAFASKQRRSPRH